VIDLIVRREIEINFRNNSIWNRIDFVIHTKFRLRKKPKHYSYYETFITHNHTEKIRSRKTSSESNEIFVAILDTI
jgi:hypothetical protein